MSGCLDGTVAGGVNTVAPYTAYVALNNGKYLQNQYQYLKMLSFTNMSQCIAV